MSLGESGSTELQFAMLGATAVESKAMELSSCSVFARGMTPWLAMFVLSLFANLARSENMDVAAVARFVNLALACVHTEYPNKISHVLNDASDVAPPHELAPAFYGCYDWHSAVHAHWLLARARARFPDGSFVPVASAVLEQDLSAEKILAELDYLRGAGRSSFERPYGLAWLLQLAAELDHPAALEPLEQEAARRILDWLPMLHYPIRTGEHNQTAFAFGLIWDWAQSAGHDDMKQLLRQKAREFYQSDRRCPLLYEPSGEDFLSPCLAEADFMRRVLGQSEYSAWLSAFLPQIPRDGSTRWLPPGVVTDRKDPKLAHIDGLNLSRAWMLRGIAKALPVRDPRRRALLASFAAHRETALPAVTGEHYEGGHWLGTFALYLETQ
ncbi:MAG: DUF2891 domain-containing protein [Steroidobacteraceae bacterium]